ncbi:MAG: DNA gyrase inhibitor YacG [Pseudomonadota bacterium]
MAHSASASSQPVKVAGARCPQCGKAAVHSVRPFCSKRCADLDLGAWLKGSYAIPADDPVGETEPEV